MNQVLVNKPHVEIYGTITCPQVFRWTRIVVFEFFAAYFFTYAVMCSYYIKQPGNVFAQNDAHSPFISLALFLVMCLCGQLTGGHANPIVTLSLFLTRGNKITLVSAIVYIISQFAGSFAGAATAYGIIEEYSCAFVPGYMTKGQVFGGEFIGSFLFIFFLLIIVNETTTFIKSNYWNYILVPLMFYIAREATAQTNGLNPASTLANQLFFYVKYRNHPLPPYSTTSATWPLHTYWVYIVGPVVGTLAATFIFNCFYLPLYIRWRSKK